MRLPVFPLAVVLFPGTPLPLHIFEPRYRRMLADCLAGDRRFGITPPGQAGEAPDPGMVGCIAEVRVNQQLPDGRSNIVVLGGERFVVSGVCSTSPLPTMSPPCGRSRSCPAPLPGAERRRSCARRSPAYADARPRAGRRRAAGSRAARGSRRPLVPRRGGARHRPRDQAAAPGRALDRAPGGGTAARAPAAHRGRGAGAGGAPARAHQRAWPRASEHASHDRSSALVEALGRIVGPRWVRHRRAELKTYTMDGLPTRESYPGIVVMPGTARRGARAGAPAPPGRRAVRRARRRHRALGRRGGRRRRGARRPHAAQPHPLASIRCAAARWCSPASSTRGSPRRWRRSACTTSPIRRARRPAPSAATSPRTPAGPHCLKYGVTTNHIVRARRRAARRLDWSCWARRTASRGAPTSSACSSGSEGMFGIATEITVRLEPVPPSVRTLLADFPTVRAASEAVSAVIATGIVPAAMEMMDQACVAAVEASIYAAGYPDRRRGRAAGRARRAAGRGRGRGRHGRARSSASAAPARCAAPRPRPTARGSGRAGRRRSAPWAGSRPTSRCRTPWCRAPRCPTSWTGSPRSATATASASATSSTRATATCTPTSRFDRRDPDARRSGCTWPAARSWPPASRPAAASPASTASAPTSSTTCRWIFDAETLGAMRAVRRVFDPAERANPGKVVPIHACREWRAAPAAAPMSDVVHGRLRALLGTGGVERDAGGLPARHPRDRRRALAGLPAGARGGLEDPGRGSGHLAPGRRAGRSRREHPRRSTRCVSVSPADLVATVQAGTPLEALRRRLADEGMWLAHRPAGAAGAEPRLRSSPPPRRARSGTASARCAITCSAAPSPPATAGW